MKSVFPLNILVLRDEEYDEGDYDESEGEPGLSKPSGVNPPPNRPQVRSESIVGK